MCNCGGNFVDINKKKDADKKNLEKNVEKKDKKVKKVDKKDKNELNKNSTLYKIFS
jgi:hypothetical protein